MRKFALYVAAYGTAAALGNAALAQPAPMPVPTGEAAYAPASEAQIKAVLDRIHGYLSYTTPAELADRTSGAPVAIADAGANAVLRRGDFRLTSYEWGVTYSGMLQASAATGDPRYAAYTRQRMDFLSAVADHYRGNPQATERANPVRNILNPNSLDDSGALAAAMIQTQRRGDPGANLRPMIDNYLGYISDKQLRLADGTLARNRPLANAVWLDDLYMSVPALAQMGALTGQRRYFDDAARQILQFSKRMFVADKGLYMHGWIQGMEPHPTFHWGRANGWAVLAMAELLDAMPANHPQRPAVLEQFKAHLMGLVKYQSGSGLWHQLIDRPDSYLETSASAMFVYGLARAINRGWLDARAFGPAAVMGWQAVANKVNARGQVEGVCVGTGMAFEPVFYYRRPTSVYAAHGYGPVLMAGAEMVTLLKKHGYVINDEAVMHSTGSSSN